METANITFEDENGNIKVHTDSEKCITCGRCITACKHNARYYVDDTERFFADLKAGVPVSLMSAPAIRTNIPEYKRLFTYLKQLGVRKIFDVSLGADICIWGYVRYMERSGFPLLITQPCPSIVSYCETYLPELLAYLSPVHSPMACTSVYMKQYKGITDRIAALSPCIAKANEFHDTGLAEYNITFMRLLEYLKDNNISLPAEETGFDHDESGPGALFPLPGGLKENIEFFLGKKLNIVKGEGYNVYEKLRKYAASPKEFLPNIFDTLNCVEGCLLGSACSHNDQNVFEINKRMSGLRTRTTIERPREYYTELYKKYDEMFDLEHFKRAYHPGSITFTQVSEAEIENAFALLGKDDFDMQNVDCSACGSETCYEMARKIALGVNVPINCMVKALANARTEHNKYIEANDRLQEAVEVARDASRVKTAFLANMSHEIRTPMNAIIGMVEILEHEALEERPMSYIKDIGISAHSLLGIINDILDMSKIESGKFELSPVNYSLPLLAENITTMFSFIAHNKNIEFLYEAIGDLPETLYGDDIRLRQVLVNICGNAIKFTKTGSVKLSMQVDNDKLIIKIKDTGMGIRNEDIPGLFNAYEQTDKVKNRTIVGTGLGLSISKSFIGMMDGDIIVESEYGHGTTFTIIIPLVLGDADSIRCTADNKTMQSLSAPGAKILVVDDNGFNLKVACGLLNLIDINADTAESGFKAIEMIQEKDYDIIFMDHMMPDMDGIETVQKIRAMGGFDHLKIVALTASAVKEMRGIFLDNGFNDFMSKPIIVAELCEVIKKYLPPEKISTSVKADTEAKTAQLDELHRKAAITFVKENRNTLNDIYASLDAGDTATAHRIAHTLKSSAAFLGKTALQEIAASLEASLKKSPPNHSSEQLGTLERELSAALLEYEPIFNEAEAAKQNSSRQSQTDSAKLAALLSEVKPLLIRGDIGASRYAEDLQGFAGMEELIEKIDDFDFEGALKALEAYTEGSSRSLTESVQKALTAADDFDSDTGLSALAGLSSPDEKLAALLDKARDAFESFDYESAVEALREVIN
jgi:signal transduction histidine kinase/CheY-like chemotaxis protein